MVQDTSGAGGNGWLESSGLVPIVRTLGAAVHPGKLGLALLAIVATLALGGVLDRIWSGVRGGVDQTAVAQYIEARRTNLPYTEPEGDRGIFSVWCRHQQRSLLGLLNSVIPGVAVPAMPATVSDLRAYSNVGVFRNMANMIHGMLWLLRCHPIYALFFGVGSLLIWGLAGGAICRMAAVQFARDERLTTAQALGSAFNKLLSGYCLAPLIPVLFAAFIALLMVIGGAILRIPLFGDVVSGLTFFLAIIGGFAITALLLGLLVGGSLFFPAVAVEGSDAFDAFSRGLSYVFSKPWKTVLYAVIAGVYVAICWLVVRLITMVTLACTRAVVAFGTAPFGWWKREVEDTSSSKLELLWPAPGPGVLYAWPDWSRLAWYEYISAFFIGLFVLGAIGLMWSFLVSMYFCVSTTVYFLLRRDVDGTDVDDIYEEEEPAPVAPAAAPSAPPEPAAAQTAAPSQEAQPAESQQPPSAASPAAGPEEQEPPPAAEDRPPETDDADEETRT